MYKLFLVLCLSLNILLGYAQPVIKLTTGIISNDNILENPNNNIQKFTSTLFEDKFYVLLQFNQLPNEVAKQKIINTGITFYNYYPDNTYAVSIPKGYNYEQLKDFNVFGVTKLEWFYKIDNSLYNPSNIPWAVKGNDLSTVVSFVKAVDKAVFTNNLLQLGYKFSFKNSILSNAVEITASIETIKLIARHPLTQFIEPIGSPAIVEDVQGITNHRNNTILTYDNYRNGKKYDGAGITVVMGDDGFVGPHIDFTGRLENRATNMASGDTHGDHVLGIIGGYNNFNSLIRGQAPAAKLITYDNYADYNAYPDIYTIDSARITSHSLGQTCNSGYNSNARTSDELINTYPLINHVHSAGNSGSSSCGGLTGGWATITGGFKAGKNSIAVANLLKDDILSSSSSKGPTKDGRLKPDISAVGTSINSTQPNNTYASLSGTSMACPAVAGSLAVLAQSYKKINNTEAPAALIKAIAMNTADDLGNQGPDFSFGFGRINMRKAIACIENTRWLSGSVTNGVTAMHAINVPSGISTMKVMVYWNDVEGTAGALTPLVNNINTTILDPTMLVHEPWVVNAGSPINSGDASSPAFKGTDAINNVEQIQIDNPTPGLHTLRVNGAAIPFGPQTYYVVIEYITTNSVVVTYPFGGEAMEPNTTQRVRWDADATDSDLFKVEYSLNNGTSWVLIANNIAGNLRFVDWPVPNSISSQARVKVTKNGDANDVSDTTFVILGRPTSVTFTEVCNGRSTLSWNAVIGATGYDVFMLGEKFMEQVTSTTNTNATINNIGNSENWFSVRARMALRGAAGLRTNAVAHTNNSGLSCPPFPVKLTNFSGKINNGKPTLFWNVALEENMIAYEIERSLLPSFENFTTVATIKPKNQGSVSLDYEIIDNERLSEGTYYYRLKMIEADKATFSRVVPINLTSKIKTGFTVFPNPALNDVFVTSGSDVLANISIYSMQGQLLHAMSKANMQKNVGFRVGVSNLASGIYSIVITNEKTGEILGKQLFNKQ